MRYAQFPIAAMLTAFVALMMVVGLAFISLVGWRLIPKREGRASRDELFSIAEYTSEVRVRDVTSEVDAETTNGGVVVSSLSGPVNARTTNGNIRVTMGQFDLASDLTFETTNGTVVAEFAQDINAEIELRTVNGRFMTDFPVTISGRIDPRRLRATLGKGGPRIRLATVNGNVELRRR